MATQRAQTKYIRIAPRKVQSVARLIRGLSVSEAEAELLHERRRASKTILKLLRSAVASAKHNQNLDVARLFVESIRVDHGPMLRRSLPRARGIATLIQKKTSHVTLILGQMTEPQQRFTIVYEKKVKLPPEERAKARKVQRQKEERESPRGRGQRGFFRRMFSRKSGM